MLPLGLFRDRTFSAANAMTLVVYAALGAVSFFVVLQLQTVGGYDALQAGRRDAADHALHAVPGLPVRGARHPDRAADPDDGGSAGDGGGGVMLVPLDEDVRYVVDVLPGLTVFGLGLAVMVAPLTGTVLAAAPDDRAGIASGVSNAVARAGSLLAVAALPTAVGLAGGEYADPAVFDAGYQRAMVVCAGLLVLGAAVSWLLIRNPLRDA